MLEIHVNLCYFISPISTFVSIYIHMYVLFTLTKTNTIPPPPQTPTPTPSTYSKNSVLEGLENLSYYFSEIYISLFWKKLH